MALRARHASVLVWLVAALSAGAAPGAGAAASGATATFDVREFGAAGDGKTLDTAAINAAVEACVKAGRSGGSVVRVPAGKYLTGTVRLRSDVTLELDAGAELIGTRDLSRYEHFTPPPDTPLVGGRVQWHRALVLGDGVENVVITGRGVINGNDVTDRDGEEGVRGPHAMLLGRAKNVTVRDVTIRNAGNYGVLFEFASGVDVRGVKITGGYDGVHLRGWRGRPCRQVSITDCEFYTGDDCVAGWYWDDVVVSRCVMNSASNGLRLFGPARKVIVHDCLMFGPGRYPWRTLGLPNRRNMAAGVCIQPSAWGETPGEVDDVRVSDVTMRDVGTPVHVANKPPSTIGRVSVDRLTATGVYRAAMSVESWATEPVGRFDLRDVMVEFVGGFGPILSDPAEAAVALMTAQMNPADVKAPGVNARPLPCWGLYGRNVGVLNLSDVKLNLQTKDKRPGVIVNGVKELLLDGVRLPKGATPAVLMKVERVTKDGVDQSLWEN